MQNDVATETALYNQIKDSLATDFKSLSQIAIGSNLPPRTDKVAKCQFAVAAPLFLLMKDKFSNGFLLIQRLLIMPKHLGLNVLLLYISWD